MVRLLLSIKADLEKVTSLVPQDDFEYFFEVKCTSCQEHHPKSVSLNRVEEYPISGGKGGTANFVWRCGNCKRENSAKFDLQQPQPYEEGANGQFSPLVTLDCRGLEFIGFEPKGIWKCLGSESGTVFADVELQDYEWNDYDEKASLPVSIMGFESKWSRL